MKEILENWQSSISGLTRNEKISILVYIASLTQECLEPLEVEISTKICSSVYRELYGNDLAVFQQFLSESEVVIQSFKVKIRNRLLWKAIWLNSLKNFSVLPSKTSNIVINDYTEVLLWCIDIILGNIDILNQNSLYLLRSLQFILNRTDILAACQSLCILKSMNKVALSPLQGFKLLSEHISKQAMKYVESSDLERICDVKLLPLKGIGTEDVIGTFTDNFIKENTEKIVKKVIMMFSHNIENKDGGLLYEKLLMFTFEEWVNNVWPHFFLKLQKIEYEGEFFQSLVKYWIPHNINAYRTDFYAFLKQEPIDLQLKVQVILESRKKGFQFEQDTEIFNCIETNNAALRIVSIYRKKSIRPENGDVTFLMNFLHMNFKTYLEDEELDSIGKILSQMIFNAHLALRKGDEEFNYYHNFVERIYKYCCKSFQTDFFQVGSQVLYILLRILKGSHKDLNLIYKLEKKDYYENKENLLFVKLNQKNMWRFDQDIYPQIRSCFLHTKCDSLILTDLLRKHYGRFDCMDPEIIKNVLNEVEDTPTLQNTEKIINCSNLLFAQKATIEITKFVKETCDLLLEKLRTRNVNEKDLFKKVLYLEILTVAKRREYEINNIQEMLQYSFELIDYILENLCTQEVSYRGMKVLETFITRVMFFISPNVKDIWPLTDKKFVVATLIKIIQKSNMKKPVSVGTEILRQFGFQMEEDERDKRFKIFLLNETLKAILEEPTGNFLKIRRSPESRLVVHAMCISQKNSNKPLLNWTMNYLLNIISDPKATDSSISSSLHTIELLICDNRLQRQTRSHLPDIIIQCVESFIRPNWIVRNADLQLVKSLIERLYGVSMNNFYRPKSISDVFIVYPQLASYFFKILSLENLDERSVIILQFFSESRVKENVFNDDISEILQYFQIIFVNIIKNYENHYGKLAVKAYVSLCLPKDIPVVFSDLEHYIINSFSEFPKNIFANLFLLLQELYEKYKTSYENCCASTDLRKIHYSWSNILKFLKNVNSNLFDFILLKLKSIDDICSEKNFTNSLWVHNNLTFFFLNANSAQICGILKEEHFQEVPEFFQIKMLSILIQRFERDEFSNEGLNEITNYLFYRALLANENNYLLNAYFKYLLIFQENLKIKFDFSVSLSKNLYKNMLSLLYLANSSSVTPDSFFVSVIGDFKNNISINEEVDIDILSTLTVSYRNFPKKCRSDIMKIVLYLSLLKSSHLEAHTFICAVMNKNYFSILEALYDFLSIENLIHMLGNEKTVQIFINDVITFLNDKEIDGKCEDEFYIVESEVLVPKHFVKKMLRCKYCVFKKIINKCL